MTTTSDCTTCDTNGRKGACAKYRCYCGHPTCWAYASWIDLDRQPINHTPTTTNRANTRQATSWAERETPTWLDK